MVEEREARQNRQRRSGAKSIHIRSVAANLKGRGMACVSMFGTVHFQMALDFRDFWKGVLRCSFLCPCVWS